MLFAVSCLDKSGHAEVRTGNRAAHIDWLKANGAAIKAAGPYLSDDGAGMTGSLLIVEAADRAALDALLGSDPYVHADLFESVTIRPWKWVIGAPA